MPTLLPAGPLADLQARSSGWKLRLRIALRALASTLLGTMLLWLAAVPIADPGHNPIALTIAAGEGALLSFVVGLPFLLGVLIVALIFANSVSRHPHLWSGATVAAVTLCSFALLYSSDRNRPHAFDLASYDWMWIRITIALVSAGAVVFSVWNIWSPLEKSGLSRTHASGYWIRGSQGVGAALLGMGVVAIAALWLGSFLKNVSCLDRGGLFNHQTGECEGMDE